MRNLIPTSEKIYYVSITEVSQLKMFKKIISSHTGTKQNPQVDSVGKILSA